MEKKYFKNDASMFACDEEKHVTSAIRHFSMEVDFYRFDSRGLKDAIPNIEEITREEYFELLKGSTYGGA